MKIPNVGNAGPAFQPPGANTPGVGSIVESKVDKQESFVTKDQSTEQKITTRAFEPVSQKDLDKKIDKNDLSEPKKKDAFETEIKIGKEDKRFEGIKSTESFTTVNNFSGSKVVNNFESESTFVSNTSKDAFTGTNRFGGEQSLNEKLSERDDSISQKRPEKDAFDSLKEGLERAEKLNDIAAVALEREIKRDEEQAKLDSPEARGEKTREEAKELATIIEAKEKQQKLDEQSSELERKVQRELALTVASERTDSKDIAEQTTSKSDQLKNAFDIFSFEGNLAQRQKDKEVKGDPIAEAEIEVKEKNIELNRELKDYRFKVDIVQDLEIKRDVEKKQLYTPRETELLQVTANERKLVRTVYDDTLDRTIEGNVEVKDNSLSQVNDREIQRSDRTEYIQEKNIELENLQERAQPLFKFKDPNYFAQLEKLQREDRLAKKENFDNLNS